MMMLLLVALTAAGVALPPAAAAGTPEAGAAVQTPAPASSLRQTDTTFAVQPGSRLQLEVFTGSATIRTWDRNAMRVVATYSRPARIAVRQRGGVVHLEAERPGSFTGAVGVNVRYEITVPSNFSVTVEGMNADVTVDGVQGNVAIENVEGAVRVVNVTGNVGITSVSGAVTVDNVRGDVNVETVNQVARVSGVRGSLNVETVNGGIQLQRIESRSVQAATVNGAVEFSGSVMDGGRYYLGTHNGRITFAVPENANATLEITTRVGQVDSAFPVRITSTRNGVVTIPLGSGSGSARVELESFNGTVRLVRP
jgi:DUF4097 and DUF4098 domain-containing protein YvlB